jgi:ABC-2 type transport system ATP-binding protein
MYYLETKDIVKQYAEHLALNGVSIAVPQGSVFGLLGPNGAGKSTLIRIITRIIAPDSGVILVNGRPFSGQDVYRIGYLPEERGLYKKMKVGDQVMYLAQLRGMSRKNAQTELTKWFRQFNITNWYNRKVEELSKGMQQKVQFIATVIHNPDLIILDEPFSGFDPLNADIIKNEILRLKNEGKTVLLSTHDMESVEELCDNIALINQSKVVLHGNVFEIRNAYRQHVLRFRLFSDDFEMENESFTVLSKEKKHEYIDVRIQKKVEMENTELIKLILNTYPVISFEEELPTMREVFVSAVTSQSIKDN